MIEAAVGFMKMLMTGMSLLLQKYLPKLLAMILAAGATIVTIYTNLAYVLLENVVLPLLPAELENAFSGFISWLEIANCWIPIGEWFVMFSVFMYFLGAFIIFRFVMKVAPLVD